LLECKKPSRFNVMALRHRCGIKLENRQQLRYVFNIRGSW